MKIKALWGFIGNALLLGAESSKVVAGQVFEKADDEYGHTLVGKGLVEELDAESRPKGRKAAAPKSSGSAAPAENKATAPTGAASDAGQVASTVVGDNPAGDAGGDAPADSTGNSAGGAE